MEEDFTHVKDAIFQSDNMSKEEKEAIISYIETKTLPLEMKGKNREKERNSLRKKASRYQLKEITTSNCLLKELYFVHKRTGVEKQVLDKSQIFPKLQMMHGFNHVGRDAML